MWSTWGKTYRRQGEGVLGSVHGQAWEQQFQPCLLLLNRFNRVRLCVTPQTAAYQAPPSLGFSRQEHWSGLLFPSPIHESEKKVKSLSRV